MAICFAASLVEQILGHSKLSDMMLEMASLLANYKPMQLKMLLSITEKQAEALCVPLSTAKSWQRWGKTGGDSLHRGREGGEGRGRAGEGRESYLSQP